MHIHFTPQVRDEVLTLSKSGDVLTINGLDFDFSPLPEGAVLPAGSIACEHIVGDVTRTNGHIVLTLLLPIAWDAPQEAAFPQPLIDPPDGLVLLPGGAR